MSEDLHSPHPATTTGPERSRSVGSMNSALSALRVLEEVALRQPIGVSDLARATQIPKSSVQRCLVTLKEAGWLRIVDRENARWGVTMKALGVGLRWAGEHDLRELATPVMQRLSRETDETVHLCLRDGADNLVIAREDSSQALRVFLEIGDRVPLRASSAGVAMIAGLEASEVDALLSERPRGYDSAKLPSANEVRAAISRYAEHGYVVNMSAWYRAHVTTFGAAIRNDVGLPMAALALALPDSRFDPADEERLGRRVAEAADEIASILASA